MSQPIHRVFISGVSEDTATAYLGHALFQALNAKWVAPEQSVALAQEDESAHWLWLYQPPWQLTDAAQPEWAAWIAQHQAALRLQRVAGPRLYVVNAARTPVAALAEALNVSAACPASQEAPSYLNALAALCAGVGATLPGVNQAWGLYETLEATAWLPSGMAPEFRASLSVDEPALASLLQVVSAGVRAPTMAQAHQATQAALEDIQQREQTLQQTTSQQKADLQTLREELQTLKETHQALQASHQSLQETHRATSEEHKEATEENDLLLAQLHHVQEELEKYFLEGQQQQLETYTRESEKELAELRAQVATLKTSLNSAQTEHTELQEENELLLAQLHQVQEELERYYLANQEFQNGIHASEVTLHRARQVISRMAAQVHGTA